jgi:vacuolar-type H+-ATPase subunit I/STV1
MPFEENPTAIENPETLGVVDGAKPEGTPATGQEQSQDQGVLLEVGGRQYRSKEDVVNKIANADAHIQRIERENAELRQKIEELTEQLMKAKDVDEVLSRLDEDKEGGERTQALTPEQVREMVMKSLEEVQTQEKQKRNLETCMAKAREVYGDNFNSKVSAMAKEMGMSVEEVNRLAANQPALFERAFIPSGRGLSSNNGFASGDIRTPVKQPPVQVDVKAPLNLSNTKERVRNFEAALQDYLSKQQI